MQTILCRPCHH